MEKSIRTKTTIIGIVYTVFFKGNNNIDEFVKENSKISNKVNNNEYKTKGKKNTICNNFYV